jgi:hypothetical protein
MTIRDAFSLIASAEDDSPEPGQVHQIHALVNAGVTLESRVAALGAELTQIRAQWRAASVEVQLRRVEGHELIAGRDAGGRRHFLAGDPVQCGSGPLPAQCRGMDPRAVRDG